MDIYFGRVSMCYYQRGFGFIKPYSISLNSELTELRQELFFHFSYYEQDKVPEKGKIVQFRLSRNDEGVMAVDIMERKKQRITLEVRAS